MEEPEKLEVGIGTIRLLSDDEKGGIIAELGSEDEIFFSVQDLESGVGQPQVAAHDLEGQIVQFVRQETDLGIYAKDVVLLTRGPVHKGLAAPRGNPRRKKRRV